MIILKIQYNWLNACLLLHFDIFRTTSMDLVSLQYLISDISCWEDRNWMNSDTIPDFGSNIVICTNIFGYA